MAGDKVNRRDFFKLGGSVALALGGAAFSERLVAAQAGPLEIRCLRNYSIGRYYFDPIGLYVTRGQTVRWLLESEGFTVAAFHPDNDNHELRIPENAKPFNSVRAPAGLADGSFEWQFDVDGTYDFYSYGHEVIGMVGRIVVGTPGGPGEKPFGYGSREGRAPIFRDAIRVFQFAKSDLIVQKKIIRYPTKELARRFPIG